MVKNFDELQRLGKDNIDLALKSFGDVSKSIQAIAAEVTDYSKKSFDGSTAAFEKLMAAKSVEKALEVQTDYLKGVYEAFVAEIGKMGDLYADLAKESCKPFEGFMVRAAK